MARCEFVGHSTALALCEKETVDAVWGIDKRCDLLRQNKALFYEPGINEKLEEHRDHKSFVAGSYEEIRHHAIDVVFFCVGTPQAPSGACDYSVLEDAVRECVARLGRQMYRTYQEDRDAKRAAAIRRDRETIRMLEIPVLEAMLHCLK